MACPVEIAAWMSAAGPLSAQRCPAGAMAAIAELQGQLERSQEQLETSAEFSGGFSARCSEK